jgi:hypothetical protein
MKYAPYFIWPILSPIYSVRPGLYMYVCALVRRPSGVRVRILDIVTAWWIFGLTPPTLVVKLRKKKRQLYRLLTFFLIASGIANQPEVEWRGKKRERRIGRRLKGFGERGRRRVRCFLLHFLVYLSFLHFFVFLPLYTQTFQRGESVVCTCLPFCHLSLSLS